MECHGNAELQQVRRQGGDTVSCCTSMKGSMERTVAKAKWGYSPGKKMLHGGLLALIAGCM